MSNFQIVEPIAIVTNEDGNSYVLDSYQDEEHDDGVDFETKFMFFLKYAHRKKIDEEEIKKPKLTRELSSTFNFVNDKVTINVPLWFRLKFDKVVIELKKKFGNEYNQFDYLI
jgi:hypothetical protein